MHTQAYDFCRCREACPRVIESGGGNAATFLERHWIPAGACPRVGESGAGMATGMVKP